jgi:hypothetical protein
MKKFASLVAAGALLLASTGVAFAQVWPSFVNQNSFTTSSTKAVSGSGLNKQFGGTFQTMGVGGSSSNAQSLTAGNVSVSGSPVVANQGAFTTSGTKAISGSGLNTQFGGGFFSSQSMTVLGSSAAAGSATISNVSFSH